MSRYLFRCPERANECPVAGIESLFFRSVITKSNTLLTCGPNDLQVNTNETGI